MLSMFLSSIKNSSRLKSSRSTVLASVSLKPKSASSVPKKPLHLTKHVSSNLKKISYDQSYKSVIPKRCYFASIKLSSTETQTALTTAERAEIVGNQALELWSNFQYQEATQKLWKYLELSTNTDLLPHIQVLEQQHVYVNIATLLMTQGRFVDSIKVYKTLIDSCNTQLSRWESSIESNKQKLETNPSDLTEDEKMEIQFKISKLNECISELSPLLATYYHDLGKAYQYHGDAMEAQKAYDVAMKRIKAHVDNRHPVLGTITASLSMLYETVGNYKPAYEFHIFLLQHHPMIERWDHPHVATILHPAQMLKDDPQETQQLIADLDKMEPGWREKEQYAEYLDGHSSYGYSHAPKTNLRDLPQIEGEVQVDQIREISAEDYHASSMTENLSSNIGPNITEETLEETNALEDSEQNPEEILTDEAIRQRQLAEYGPQAKLVEGMLAEQKQNLGKHHMFLVQSLIHLSILNKNMSKYAEAKQNLLEALEIVEQLKGKKHANIATIFCHLAILSTAQKQIEEAQAWYSRALLIREELLGAEHPHVALIKYDLAVLLSIKDTKLSIENLKDSYTIFQRTLYDQHPYTMSSKQSLEKAYEMIQQQQIDYIEKRMQGIK